MSVNFGSLSVGGSLNRPLFHSSGGSWHLRHTRHSNTYYSNPSSTRSGSYVPNVGARHHYHPTHNRFAAVKGESTSKTAAGGLLQPGLLVAFKKDERTELGLVLQPDGKKNWWITNQTGRRTSLPSKSVVLVLPGSGYTPGSLQQFIAAAAGADASLLEIAWAVAAEEVPSSSYSLSALSKLLFDADGAQDQFVTFSLLLSDKVYFKSSYKAGIWSFQPKEAEVVEQAAAAVAAEAAEAAAREAFLRDWSAAVVATAKERPENVLQLQQQWLAGPHVQKIQALMDFALNPADKCPKASDALAREVLSLLKRRPEPDVAASLLQDAGLLRLHEPLPLLRLGHNAEGQFEPRLQAAAEALLRDPPADPDASSRLDLTHLSVFTIDDASTTEVDDGVSVELDQEGGGLRLWVHVADPTRWLNAGDVLDMEARSRTRSLYFPFASIPMFPRCLAEGPFSLVGHSSSSSSTADSPEAAAAADACNADHTGTCDALSVCIALADDGSLGRLVTIGPSRIRVSHRLTYDEVDADLGLGPGMCRYEELQQLFEAARLRRAWRVSQGCIDIDLPEAKLEVAAEQLDALTPAVTCTKLSQWESAARLLVAEMMILAGEAVGQLGVSAALPLPYRGQDAPSLPPREVLDLLPEGPCKGFALRKCMTRSTVSPKPVRHASLALDAYVQFTSPIRRYTDLIAHFNIKAHLRGEPPPFSASDITTITAAAGEVARDLGRAEGDVERYWAAEYLRQQWQRQQHRQRQQRLQQQQQQAEPGGWPALVLGWVRPDLGLAAVTLEQLGLESVIKVDFPVEPGDRLLLHLAEVDVKGSYFRLVVQDRLDHPQAAVQLQDSDVDQDSIEQAYAADLEDEGELEENAAVPVAAVEQLAGQLTQQHGANVQQAAERLSWRQAGTAEGASSSSSQTVGDGETSSSNNRSSGSSSAGLGEGSSSLQGSSSSEEVAVCKEGG